MFSCSKKLLAIAVTAPCLVSPLASAVEPNPIQAGAFDLIPTIKVDTSQDDNIFRTDTNETDSNITVIAPRLQGIATSNANQFNFDLEAIKGIYSATDEDDYDDWRGAVGAHVEMTSRNILEFDYSHDATHEIRGLGFSEGGNLPPTPDEYDLDQWNASYQFGSNDSFGRLRFSIGNNDKEYTNNRLTTAVRDVETDLSGAELFINLSPRTAILFEYRKREVDYQTDLPPVIGSPDTLDSDETYGFVGIEWEATASTTGSIRIGTGEKDFVDPDRQDLDDPSYELGLTWSPLTYSTFTFSASRLFDETTGQGNSIDRTSYFGSWNHEWTSRLSTNVSASLSTEEYAGSLRDDDLSYYSFGLTYSVARWLDVRVEMGLDNRDSGVSNFNYDRTVYAVGFDASL